MNKPAFIPSSDQAITTGNNNLRGQVLVGHVFDIVDLHGVYNVILTRRIAGVKITCFAIVLKYDGVLSIRRIALNKGFLSDVYHFFRDNVSSHE